MDVQWAKYGEKMALLICVGLYGVENVRIPGQANEQIPGHIQDILIFQATINFLSNYSVYYSKLALNCTHKLAHLAEI